MSGVHPLSPGLIAAWREGVKKGGLADAEVIRILDALDAQAARIESYQRWLDQAGIALDAQDEALRGRS